MFKYNKMRFHCHGDSVSFTLLWGTDKRIFRVKKFRSRFSRVEFCSATENLRSEFLWNMNKRHHRLHEESSFLFFTLSAILLLLAASKFNHLSDISYAVSCCWQLSRIFVMLGERQNKRNDLPIRACKSSIGISI